ncbi:hypothetical protein JQS43_20145 [Natronosporangium hydrolyticum]|uniref:Uncharacterized protein n=1 Tax=Natronosporangium hydrolyticum TaxID=2811111 RepID=A0A895YI75_9ACTN|nr:hypothetical protein [Natronosporangium hydrolyticum]QSB13840.1 hypothetical protein JQS43_20145 [Natronosporangium hydrolyticum]
MEQTEAEIAAFAALQGSGDGQPTDVVRRVTGRPATDFESYVKTAAAAGAWHG